MDLSQVITEIRRGLGYRTTLESTIIGAVQSVQRTLETGMSLPDFLLVYDAPIAVVGGTATFTLPTNFLRMHDAYDLYYDDPTDGYTVLPRKTEVEAVTAYGDITDSTHGKVWVRRSNSQGLLVPTPTASATYYLTYYAADAVLTAGGDTNLWLTNLPDVIVGLAGIECLGAARDKEAMMYFQQRAQRGERTRMGMIVDQELQGRPILMGRNN